MKFMKKKISEEKASAKAPPKKIVSSMQAFYLRTFMSRVNKRGLANHFIGNKAKGRISNC